MTADWNGDPERLVIYPSRAKMLLVLLGAMVFVLLGLWIASPKMSRVVPIWDVLIASYVGVPFFGVCGLYAAYRLVRRRPSVVIDATGITDTSNAFAVGRLSWAEIDHMALYQSYGQWMLGIVPRDLEGFLIRQPSERRSYIKLNLSLGYSPINIAQVAISMRLADLAELLRARYGVRIEGIA